MSLAAGARIGAIPDRSAYLLRRYGRGLSRGGREGPSRHVAIKVLPEALAYDGRANGRQRGMTRMVTGDR
jgi:hypothetical protein